MAEKKPKSIPVYILDKDKALICKVLAYEFALAPGQYNIPYGAVTVAPPEGYEKMHCVWKTTELEESPDYHCKGIWEWEKKEPAMPTLVAVEGTE